MGVVDIHGNPVCVYYVCMPSSPSQAAKLYRSLYLVGGHRRAYITDGVPVAFDYLGHKTTGGTRLVDLTDPLSARSRDAAE
jgi:hypothetical protein